MFKKSSEEQKFIDRLNPKWFEEKFIYYMKDGTSFIATLDTTTESDNGLEIGELDYEDFYEYLFKVYKIIKKTQNENITEGLLYEISKYNMPEKVTDLEGNVLFERES